MGEADAGIRCQARMLEAGCCCQVAMSDKDAGPGHPSRTRMVTTSARCQHGEQMLDSDAQPGFGRVNAGGLLYGRRKLKSLTNASS
jgi:hypothetical protein